MINQRISIKTTIANGMRSMSKIVSFPAVLKRSLTPGIPYLWTDEPWTMILRDYAKANKLGPDTKVRITIQPWSDDCSERAFNLFHALRDRLAQETAGIDETYPDREYLEHLKQSLKLDYGKKDEIRPGIFELKSTTKYTVREMMGLVNGTIDECEKAGADIHDLIPEYNEIRNDKV